MASNRLPHKLDRLLARCEDNCDGLQLHGLPLNVKQTTETVLRSALAATRTAETAYGNTKVAKKAANAVLTAADKAGCVFITNARTRLAKFLGEDASTEWAAAGWPEGSTACPKEQDLRYNLIISLSAYFTNHPAHESVDLEVSAALAEAAHTAISDARAALGQAFTASGNAKAARDTAEANLRKRMTALVGELELLLPPDSPIWHAFGLSRPVDEDTPESPTLLVITLGVLGTLLVDWADALRADHYRVWILIVGTDTDFRAVESPYDSDATLSALPSGATVKVRITAVNAAGESGPSATVEAIVP